MDPGWTHASANELFVALVAVAFASFLLIYYYAEARRRKHLPPGPWPWPVVGNFSALGKLPHRSLEKLAAKYGGLMYLRLGSQPCIVISTAAVAKEFYKTVDASFGSRPKRLSWTVWHHGDENYRTLSVTSDLPYWRRLRRFFNAELFSPKRHASQREIRAEEIRHMMKLLVKDCKKGEPVDIKAWLYGVTSNTMTRIIVGKRFYGSSEAGAEKQREDLMKMNSTLFDLAGAVVISDFVPYLSFVNRLQGHAAKFAKVRDFCDGFTKKIFDLEGHRQQLKERRDDPSYVRDLEDVLLETPMDDGEYLPDKDMLKVLQDILNGGTETSATLIEWAMAELILHPSLLQRAQRELSSHIPSSSPPRLVLESDLPHLPFLAAIIKEAFRMHPPVPLLIPHVSHTATTFLGYHFPPGTLLILNAFVIHKDKSIYENPEKFDPERFIGSEVSQLSVSEGYELMPFGKGTRMCPAFNLGNTIATLMLGNLLHCLDWEVPEKKVEMEEAIGLSVGMKVPLCLCAKPKFELL